MEWSILYLIEVLLGLIGAFIRLLMTNGWNGFTKKDVPKVAVERWVECVLIGISFWTVIGVVIYLIVKKVNVQI